MKEGADKYLNYRYMPVLILLGTLAIGSYALLEAAIVSQETGAAEINMSGRQRMLSQRIALLSSQLNLVEDQKLRSSISEELGQAVQLMESSHLSLTLGNVDRGISPPSSEELLALYFGPKEFVDEKIKAFLSLAKTHHHSSSAGKDSLNDWHIYGNFDLNGLLNNLNAIVSVYQAENEGKIATLQTYQTISLVLTLVLLGGSGWFVFRPMVSRIQNYIFEIKVAEERFRSISTSSSIAMVVSIDQTGTVLTWNPAAEKTFGYTEKEIIGSSLTTIMPERYRAAHSEGIARASNTDDYHILNKTIEVHGLKKNGEEFPLELSLGTWEQGGRKYFSAIIHDITERRKRDENLRERNKSIELLQRVAAIANEVSDVDAAMQACLDLVCNYSNWAIGHVYKLDKEKGDLYPTQLWHINPPDKFRSFQQLTEKTRFVSGVGLPGRVLSEGEPAWIVDISEDDNFPRLRMQKDTGLISAFAFPIQVEDSTVAVMEFFSTDHQEPISSLFEIMDHISNQIGQAISREGSRDALVKNEEKLRSIINSSNKTAILSINTHGELLTWNTGAEKLFGYTEDEISGRSLTSLIPKRYQNAHREGLKRATDTDDYHVIGKTVELSGIHKNGHEFPLDLALGVWEDDGQKYFSAIINDITNRKQAEDKIHQLAYTDPQTGLPNEVSFLEQLNELLNQNKAGFVVSVELSGVGDIIGTFGLEAADLIFYQFGDRLSKQMNTLSIVAKVGPRSFKIAYIPDETEKMTQVEIANNIFKVAQQPFDLMGSEVPVNVYMGVRDIDVETSTAQTLMTDLEIAHHEALKSLSSSIVFFNNSIKDDVVRSTQIVSWLHSAIGNNVFQLFFQPQVNLKTNEIVGCEALIRWHRSSGEWISPAEFIPIAEKAGMIGDITRWTAYEACRISSSWALEEGIKVRVGLNISAEELSSPDFLDYIINSIEETKLSPELLEIEITETALMKNPEIASANLKKIRDMGASVAIDDFGTGQASLAYLKHFPIDRLKIDQSFVKGAPENNTDREIIVSVVKLAHSLDMEVIAEGAEEKEHIDLLVSLGCDEVQGYFIAKPMPADQFVEFFNEYS